MTINMTNTDETETDYEDYSDLCGTKSHTERLTNHGKTSKHDKKQVHIKSSKCSKNVAKSHLC